MLDSPEDKLAVKKAIKVVPIAQEIYDMEDQQTEDVAFALFDIEQITLGETFKIAMSIHVRAIAADARAITFTSFSRRICFAIEHVLGTTFHIDRIVGVVNPVHRHNSQQN